MASLSLSRLLSLPPGLRSLAWQQQQHARLLSPLSSTNLYIPRHHRLSRAYSSTTQDAPHEPPSSVNHAEVSHFNHLASSWWDPHGSSRLLHLMNPLRHDFLRRCLGTQPREIDQKLAYLDIGCGGGIFAESAARLHDTAHVTAIDPTPEVIAVAKQHRRQDPLLLEPGRLQYLNIPIEELDSRQETPDKAKYDIVTLFEVVEHIQHPAPFLTNCLQHLKPGGWLIGSTIARTNTSWFTTKLVAEDLLRIVPRGTHDWSQYIQPHELKTWASGNDQLDAEGPGWQVMGVMYVPGLGWKEIGGSEEWGNYFFGIRKKPTHP